MFNNVERFFILVACLGVIAVAGLYIGQRVHYGCLFGNCALVVTK